MDFEHRGWPPQPPTEIVPNLTTESIISANVFFFLKKKKKDSIHHLNTEISIEIICEAFSDLINHIHHDNLTDLNDFSDSYGL